MSATSLALRRTVRAKEQVATARLITYMHAPLDPSQKIESEMTLLDSPSMNDRLDARSASWTMSRRADVNLRIELLWYDDEAILVLGKPAAANIRSQLCT